MLSVVTWLWHRSGYRSTFSGEHVNRLAAMVDRHYAKPARFICVTNEPDGIDSSITIVADRADFAAVPPPHGHGFPACYRRLRMFDPDIGRHFGERFVSIDLDVVAVADLTPLWNRPEDIVLYRDPLHPTQYCGSMVLMTAGARPDVWTAFDPDRSPQLARGAGFLGSDQAWLSLRLPGEATWGPKDGVYSFRKDIEPNGGKLPAGARLVIAHGAHDPWGPRMQALPWVREHWGNVSKTVSA